MGNGKLHWFLLQVKQSVCTLPAPLHTYLYWFAHWLSEYECASFSNVDGYLSKEPCVRALHFQPGGCGKLNHEDELWQRNTSRRVDGKCIWLSKDTLMHRQVKHAASGFPPIRHLVPARDIFLVTGKSKASAKLSQTSHPTSPPCTDGCKLKLQLC